MNEFYHEFSVGFNWWYVVAPVMLVMSGCFGLKQYHVRRSRAGDLVVRKKFNERPFLMWAVLSGIIVCVLMFVESWDGAIQALDNNGDIYWSRGVSIVSVALGIPVLSALYAAAVYWVARTMSYTKRGYLEEKCDKIKREQNKQAKNQIQTQHENQKKSIKLMAPPM